MVAELHDNANILLGHFHYLTKGFHPFALDWNPAESATMAELTDHQVHFIRETAGYAQQNGNNICVHPFLAAVLTKVCSPQRIISRKSSSHVPITIISTSYLSCMNKIGSQGGLSKCLLNQICHSSNLRLLSLCMNLEQSFNHPLPTRGNTEDAPAPPPRLPGHQTHLRFYLTNCWFAYPTPPFLLWFGQSDLLALS
jgi:hypothetical protein